MEQKINLAIIFGGPSGEHEVSLRSAQGVLASLDKEKYKIIPIAIDRQGKWLLGEKGQQYLRLNTQDKSMEQQLANEESQSAITVENRNLTDWSEGEPGVEKIDLVLPIGHGSYIEDGKLQGMLDMLGIKYVFSGALASALAMNKPKTKVFAKAAGLTVLPSIVLKKGDDFEVDKITNDLGLPLVVKPSELGSSVGISIPKTEEDLLVAITTAFKYCSEIMLEKYIRGRELTCGVWGNNPPQALPVVEIIPKISGFFDYKAKYEKGGSEEVCPANIPAAVQERVQKDSVKIFQTLGCCDLARADYIWDEANDELFFLEINTIPGMTSTSLVPQEAKAAGLQFSDFLDKLIEEALNRLKNG